MWSDGKQIIVPGSFSAFEGCCVQEEAWIVGKPDLDVPQQQCAGSHIAPHPQLSGKTSHICCAPSTLFSGLSPSRFFPKLKTILKGRRFQTIEEIQEIQRTACARAQFSRCSLTNAHSKTGQMAVRSQNPTLGALSSRSALSMLVVSYLQSSISFWTCLVFYFYQFPYVQAPIPVQSCYVRCLESFLIPDVHLCY